MLMPEPASSPLFLAPGPRGKGPRGSRSTDTLSSLVGQTAPPIKELGGAWDPVTSCAHLQGKRAPKR